MIAAVAAFFLLWLLYRPYGFRTSWVFASVTWSFFAVLFTWALSFGIQLDQLHLFVVWCLFDVAIFSLVLYRGRLKAMRLGKRLKMLVRSADYEQMVYSAFLFSVLVGTLWVALSSPPNNWDSMTYHLSRIEHWIQNRSIVFYRTNIPRQLTMGPFAEIAILQFRLLSGSDRFDNLIQWSALGGVGMVSSLIAQWFGMPFSGQLIAAVLSISVPMAVLQASSTQNDLVASLWIMIVAYLTLKTIKKRETVVVTLLGIAAGLAVLTKATSYVYLLPFFVWFIAERNLCVFRWNELRLYVWGAFLFLLINICQDVQNYQVFRSVFGENTTQYVVGTLEPNVLFINMIKNISIQLGTPFMNINARLNNAIVALSRTLSVFLNDPRSTYLGDAFRIIPLNTDEGYAGNLLHFIAAVCVTLYVALRRKLVQPLVRRYLAASVIGYALFCIGIRWQEWSSRLQLPFFLILSPAIAYVIYRWRRIRVVMVTVIAVTSLYWVYFNGLRPLLGMRSILVSPSETIVFIARPSLLKPYADTVRYITEHNYRRIGLCFGGDDWEYPLWSDFRKQYGMKFRMEHVGVTNETGQLPLTFSPDVIIALNCSYSVDKVYPSRDIKQFGPIAVIPIKD